jgi:hypothetical protein
MSKAFVHGEESEWLLWAQDLMEEKEKLWSNRKLAGYFSNVNMASF